MVERSIDWHTIVFCDSCFHRLAGTQCNTALGLPQPPGYCFGQRAKPKSQKLSVLVGLLATATVQSAVSEVLSCGAGTAVGQRPAPFLVPPTLSTTLSAVNSAGGQHRAGQTRRACSPRRRARAPSPFCSAGAFPRRPRRRAPSPRCMPPPSPRRGLCDVIGTRLMSFPPDGPTDPQVPWLWHGHAPSTAALGPGRGPKVSSKSPSRTD